MAGLTPFTLLNSQEECIFGEPIKKAPECMNDVVKNVQEISTREEKKEWFR